MKLVYCNTGEEHKIQEPHPGRFGEQTFGGGVVLGTIRRVRRGDTRGPHDGHHMLPVPVPARRQHARQPSVTGRPLVGIC